MNLGGERYSFYIWSTHFRATDKNRIGYYDALFSIKSVRRPYFSNFDKFATHKFSQKENFVIFQQEGIDKT